MNTYDSGKMRGCAQDIRSELKTYNSAKTAVDNIVTKLRNNWQDTNNTSYTQKYNQEAKIAAENVAKLMNQFAEALESSAAALEKIHNSASNDING